MLRFFSVLSFLVALNSTTILAQDVTLTGPAGCNAAPVAGAFPVPCGVTSVMVELYGGGGGGGGRGGGSNGGFFDSRGGGGGGGGGYVSFTATVTPGSIFTYSVGAGGCGGDEGGDGSDGDNGVAGGNTTVTGTDALGNPVNLSANGGALGTGGDGSEGSPGNGGAGGVASGGTTNTNGAAGANGSGGNGGAGGAGAGPSATYGNGGVGGGDPGGNGTAGAILITFVGGSGPAVTPTIANSPATCSSAGTSTVTNYVAAETYTFAPVGPTVGAGGTITGMVPGTSYTLTAGAGACAAPPSVPFSNAMATGSVVDPVIASVAASCTADGSSTITTYNPANTYTFNPAGPTVGAGGAISGMTLGTSYTVTESDLTCTSAPSAPFSNQAQFPTPVISISGSLSYCAGQTTTLTASGGVSYLWDDASNSTTAAITVTQGTYNVGALDANGCPGTASATVTETPPFAITFSGALSHCAGGTTTITASGGSTYVWDTGETTSSITVSQGTYSVTATNAGGCVSTDNVTITQSGNPVSDFTVVDACAGTTVEFFDATTIATGTLTDWLWDFGDGTSSTLQDPTHIYAAPGVYNVTLTASAGNCSDMITLPANSFPAPIANFTTANVCVGTPADFVDNSYVTGSTISQWVWDFDGLGTASQASPSYTFATAGTYDVTLAVLTSDFCAATYTAPITIHPAPTPAFTAAAVCVGNATTFQNQSTVTPGSIAAQVWDFGDNLGLSTLIAPTYTYAAPGTYPVTLGVNTANGCVAVVIQDITVNALPTIAATHTDVLCSGEANGTATAAASGGSAPYSFQWNNPLQSTSPSIQNLIGGNYTVTVTDNRGCTNDTTVTVVSPLPIRVDLTSGPDTCNLGNGAIRATMIGGTTPFVYNWSAINDSASIYSTSVPASGWNTLLTPGNYSVLVTDAGGCTTTGETAVGLIPSPVAAFTTRSKPEEFVNPDVQFENLSTGAITYEWHFGEGNISYEEDPEHEYELPGSYLVMLVAYNDPAYGCADTTFRYVEVDPLFTFYIPNAFTPDDDGKNDTWGPVGDNFEYESYNVQIFDRWGGLVWQTDNYATQWDGRNMKTLKPVKQGMYGYQFLVKKFNTFEPRKITGTVTVYMHKQLD
ncbi:MAG: PKD domain-containing protein [Flavobacteriales bacterium]|nr:PKD domain-containing protein [Flavobacteriales bacterium]